MRLYLPGLEVSLFPCLSHCCGRTIPGQTSCKLCIQTAPEKDGKTRRDWMDWKRRFPRARSLSPSPLIFLVFVPIFSLCPTSHFQTAAWTSSWFHPVQKQRICTVSPGLRIMSKQYKISLYLYIFKIIFMFDVKSLIKG